MDEIKILTNEELGLYDEFSLSFNPVSYTHLQ